MFYNNGYDLIEFVLLWKCKVFCNNLTSDTWLTTASVINALGWMGLMEYELRVWMWVRWKLSDFTGAKGDCSRLCKVI